MTTGCEQPCRPRSIGRIDWSEERSSLDGGATRVARHGQICSVVSDEQCEIVVHYVEEGDPTKNPSRVHRRWCCKDGEGVQSLLCFLIFKSQDKKARDSGVEMNSTCRS